MSIFYGAAEKPDFLVPFHKIRATEGYLRHYENYLTLGLIQRSTKDRAEKQQATQELTVCERKMAWMKRHPNFEQAEALQGVEKLMRMWRTKL